MFTPCQDGASRPPGITPPIGNPGSISDFPLVSLSVRDSSRTPQINYCHSDIGHIRVPIKDSLAAPRRTLGGYDAN